MCLLLTPKTSKCYCMTPTGKNHKVPNDRLLFRYPFHPSVTAVARKRSWSFCKKYWWQVTAKQACTLRMWLCMVTWCMVVWCTQNLRRDGSSFMWHQPCQCCKYTTSVDIQKCTMKTSHLCRIACEGNESAQEWRIALYKSDQQQQRQQ